MKKLLSMVLALALVLVSVAAIADTSATVGSDGSISVTVPDSRTGETIITITITDVVYGDNDSSTTTTDDHSTTTTTTDTTTTTTTTTTETTTTTTNNTNTDNNGTIISGDGNDGNNIDSTVGTTTKPTKTPKPTTKPTKTPKPTTKPTKTPKPTTKPTTAPTDKPTTAPTSKPTSNGGSGKSSGGSNGSSDTSTGIDLIIVSDTAETTALKNEFAEALKNGDVKDALPDSVKSKLSDDLKTMNEFVTAKLVGDVSNIVSATVNIKFDTLYSTNDTAVMLFGVPSGSSTNWYTANGAIESDGSISVVLNATLLDALASKTFALAVLSKN